MNLIASSSASPGMIRTSANNVRIAGNPPGTAPKPEKMFEQPTYRHCRAWRETPDRFQHCGGSEFGKAVLGPPLGPDPIMDKE
jgi:hypothetical protein